VPRSKADEVMNAALDNWKGQTKQGGLLDGDDDSLTQFLHILGRCLILDH
jgi:hypothetical protein